MRLDRGGHTEGNVKDKDNAHYEEISLIDQLPKAALGITKSR
jgi:hypothetical protein